MASQNMGIEIELCKGSLQLACPTGVGKMLVFAKRVLLTQGTKIAPGQIRPAPGQTIVPDRFPGPKFNSSFKTLPHCVLF